MDFNTSVNSLRYLLFSRHGRGHGIHSPYAYKLISELFRNKIDPEIVSIIENIRKVNLSDKRLIEVLDLGAGSLRMKTNFRRVSDITKYSSVPHKYGIILYNTAARFGSSGIVELGTSFGISTIYLAMGSPGATVHTIEGCPRCAEIADENFVRAKLSNIDMMNGSFDEMIPRVMNLPEKPGVVFIDGNHRKEPLLKYFNMLAGKMADESVLIIDDINLSDEMRSAWKEISMSSNVSFTIDINRMGMAFFKKGTAHINYIIRY